MIRWMSRVLPRWLTVDREIRDELEFHLAERTRELEASGLPAKAARARAEREFGDLETARSELTRIDSAAARTARRMAWWEDLWLDLRFGARTLRRNPGFTAIVVVTLGVAIGANTTIFSVYQTALLRALPYRDPGALYQVWETSPTSSRGRSEASWPDFADWRAAGAGAIDLEGYDPTNVILSSPQGATMVSGGRVTTGFFDLLGVNPVLGRTFLSEDEQPGGGSAVVLSHALWVGRFGRDPAVLDSAVQIDGRAYRVIGVLPSGFHFAPAGDAALWVTLDAADRRREFRFNHWVNVVARVRAGVDPEAALARLRAAAELLEREYPQTNAGRGVVAQPIADAISGGVRPTLVLLLLAMTAVLAVACANVAGLLVARGLAREREIIVRAALGASHWRLGRQLVVESLLLTGLAGLVGVALARLGVGVAIAALPPGLADHLPFLRDAGLDLPVLGYTAAVILVTGIGLSVGPILHLAGPGGLARPQGHGSSASNRMSRLRDALIVGEVALTLILLSGAAVLGRSVRNLLDTELGFEPEQAVTVRVALSGPAYEQDAPQQRFFARLFEEVAAIPGVRSAGGVSRLPLNGGNTSSLVADGREVREGEAPVALVRVVGGDYFRAVGIPLVRGRDFTATDDSTAAHVALLSHALATSLFGSEDPIGRQLRFKFAPEESWQVIGVIADARTGTLEQSSAPTIYLSHLQAASNRMSLVLRTSADPGAIVPLVRRAAAGLDLTAAVYAANTMAGVVRDSDAVALRRLPLILLATFGVVSVLLAVVGLYGAVTYAVAQRNRELAIRLALGASPRAIRARVLRYGAGLAAKGLAGGLLLTLALSRVLRGGFAGTEAAGPGPVAAAALLLGVVALVASYVPARRVVALDPITVLRSD